MKIQLVSPTERCRASFLLGLREFQHEGLPWHVGVDLEAVEQDFAAFVAAKLADSNRRTEAFVPRTHLWAVAEGQFVGRISILHEVDVCAVRRARTLPLVLCGVGEVLERALPTADLPAQVLA